MNISAHVLEAAEIKGLAEMAIEKISPSARPKYVRAIYADPFDDRFLGSSEWPYEPRRAADGFYTKAIHIMTQGLKEIQSDILQGRTPKVSVLIFR